MTEGQTPSNRWDLSSPTANMFGYQPCPKCRDWHRYSFKDTPTAIRCDNCGFMEEVEKVTPND